MGLKPTPSMGQWAHDIADQYDALADDETWPLRRGALRAAAAKYRGIGRRMDKIRRPTPDPSTEGGSA